MRIPSLNVDTKGDSYFAEIELNDQSNKPRQQDVVYWQFWETQPGHYQDFKPIEDPCCFAVLSGKLQITSSVGEKRYFSRGDVVYMQDVSGKGHTVRTYGIEPCQVLRIGMKQAMSENA